MERNIMVSRFFVNTITSTLLWGALYAGDEVQIISIPRSAVNDSIKVRVASDEVINTKDPFYVKVISFPLGVETIDTDQAFKDFAKNPDGSTILLIFEGKERLYITYKDNAPFIEQRTYFQKRFRKRLSSEFIATLTKGRNVVTALALTSWNESIKLPNAVDIVYMDIEKRGEIAPALEKALHKPYLIYNQPYGSFWEKQPILLDFYLFNVSLSQGGYRVKVVIDGVVVDEIKEWLPYAIQGLSKGKHEVKLVLFDKKTGQEVPGPYGDQKQTIHVMENKKT